VFDRTTDIEAAYTNHGQIDFDLDPSRSLSALEAPALVLHGTEDPIAPFPNALALRDLIPRAELVELEQTGHELPARTWDTVTEAILRHTAKA
jgi:pimeloyl-ACP methyl ester carboxylesterase